MLKEIVSLTAAAWKDGRQTENLQKYPENLRG